jgi:hypothetical protein
VNFERELGEGIIQAPLNQRYGKVRDVDPGPVAAKLLRRVNGRAAAAERV